MCTLCYNGMRCVIRSDDVEREAASSIVPCMAWNNQFMAGVLCREQAHVAMMKVCDPCRSERFYVSQNMIWQRLISIKRVCLRALRANATKGSISSLCVWLFIGSFIVNAIQSVIADVIRWLSWLSNIMTLASHNVRHHKYTDCMYIEIYNAHTHIKYIIGATYQKHFSTIHK